MAMRRTPSPPGVGRVSFHGALVRPLFLLLTLSLLPQACQKDDDELLKPGEVASNIVTVVYRPANEFLHNEIEMDGEAKDKEWGGPLNVDRPYTQIRLTAAEGAGDPGEPIYVSMKAIYTETDIYFLFRWVDEFPNMMKDALQYVGPDLTLRTGRQEILLDESSWARNSARFAQEDEDRLTLALEVDSVYDALGSFREQGCLVACHLNQSPIFGRPARGRLDVWQWLGCRTNPVRNTYYSEVSGNFPIFGIPGYLDDCGADPVAGLVADPGRSCWFPNTLPGSNRPRWIYRPGDDPFNKPPDPANCFSDFGEDCRMNNGLATYYIWRNDVERIPLEFSSVDTINNAVLPAGREARRWRRYDRVSAYYYTYPTGSRADVRGKAAFAEETGLWTLEMARPLRTDDAFNDVQFVAQPDSVEIFPDVVFAVAVANNSATRHWGSGPQVLRFGPKPQVPAGAPGNGDGR